MIDRCRHLLEIARRSMSDAESDISQAVRALEEGANLDVVALLGEAMTRLRIMDAEIQRYLSGSGHRKQVDHDQRGDRPVLDQEEAD